MLQETGCSNPGRITVYPDRVVFVLSRLHVQADFGLQP